MDNLNALMWVFTLVLLFGFFVTYKNLNGENVLFDHKYEGLIIASIGLALSVITGVKSSRKGLESFVSLYM